MPSNKPAVTGLTIWQIYCDHKMQGGFPISNYNKHSRWQARIAWGTKLLVDRALAALAHSDATSINILDLGCSEGLNTNVFLYNALKTFRSYSSIPITLFWNDLPNNNWNAVSNLFNSAQSVGELPDTYIHLTPRSFYKAVLPKSTAHLAISCSSFHFLSKQLRAPDSFLPANSACKDIQDLAARQSIEDTKKILGLRYEELVPGGQLIFTSLFRPPSGYQSMYVVVEAAFKEICRRGVISAEESHDFGMSLYERRQEDWDEIFSATKSMFKVRHFTVERFLSPYYEDFLKTKDLDAYIADCSGTFRVLVEPLFKQCLKTSDPSTFDEFMSEIHHQIRVNPYMEFYCSIVNLEKLHPN